MRPTLRTLSAGMLAALALVQPAAAQVAGCSGNNLHEALKASDPTAFEAIRKAATATAHANTLLWKVEHEKARGTSYLFATLAVTDDRVQKFSPAVEQAMSSVRRVAVDVSRVEARRLAEGLNTFHSKGKLVLADGSALAAHLTEAEQQTTVKALAKTGLPADLIARVQPWAAMAVLATGDCEQRRLRAGKLPTNAYIATLAERRGSGTVDLETVETQFEAAAGLPQNAQVALLKARVAALPMDDDLNETLVQLYLAKDLGAMWPLQAALARKAGVSDAALDLYREQVIVERSKRLANRLHHHLVRGGVFVAVDQALMVGDTGIVAQLMAAPGFTVTPLE